MKPVRVSRTIDAPLALVFEMISDVRRFREAVPHITDIEFLTDQQHGVGTRFKETRVMKGKEHASVLEVTEYELNRKVRMVSDAGGTIWDTVFTVNQSDGPVQMDMQMDIRPHTLMARLMTPLIRGMVVKGVEDDMDAVKAFCESASSNTGDDSP